jgi:hypothetical protein
MKRFGFAGSTTNPTEPGERLRCEDVVLATTVIHVELGPVPDSDELTDTEWSAFMVHDLPGNP